MDLTKDVEIEECDLLSHEDEDELDHKLFDRVITLNQFDFLILVSFRLPLQVNRTDKGLQLRDLISTNIYPTIFKIKNEGFLNFKWIGWPGIYPKDEIEKLAIEKLLATQKCVPIWFTKHDIDKFTLFHEKFMRPLFHSFKGPDDNDIDTKNTEYWSVYKTVNQ